MLRNKKDKGKKRCQLVVVVGSLQLHWWVPTQYKMKRPLLLCLLAATTATALRLPPGRASLVASRARATLRARLGVSMDSTSEFEAPEWPVSAKKPPMLWRVPDSDAYRTSVTELYGSLGGAEDAPLPAPASSAASPRDVVAAAVAAAAVPELNAVMEGKTRGDDVAAAVVRELYALIEEKARDDEPNTVAEEAQIRAVKNDAVVTSAPTTSEPVASAPSTGEAVARAPVASEPEVASAPSVFAPLIADCDLNAAIEAQARDDKPAVAKAQMRTVQDTNPAAAEEAAAPKTSEVLAPPTAVRDLNAAMEAKARGDKPAVQMRTVQDTNPVAAEEAAAPTTSELLSPPPAGDDEPADSELSEVPRTPPTARALVSDLNAAAARDLNAAMGGDNPAVAKAQMRTVQDSDLAVAEAATAPTTSELLSPPPAGDDELADSEVAEAPRAPLSAIALVSDLNAAAARDLDAAMGGDNPAVAKAQMRTVQDSDPAVAEAPRAPPSARALVSDLNAAAARDLNAAMEEKAHGDEAGDDVAAEEEEEEEEAPAPRTTERPIFSFSARDAAMRRDAVAAFERIDDVIMGGVSSSELKAHRPRPIRARAARRYRYLYLYIHIYISPRADG